MSHEMPKPKYGFDAFETAWHYWHGGWDAVNAAAGFGAASTAQAVAAVSTAAPFASSASTKTAFAVASTRSSTGAASTKTAFAAASTKTAFAAASTRSTDPLGDERVPSTRVRVRTCVCACVRARARVRNCFHAHVKLANWHWCCVLHVAAMLPVRATGPCYSNLGIKRHFLHFRGLLKDTNLFSVQAMSLCNACVSCDAPGGLVP